MHECLHTHTHTFTRTHIITLFTRALAHTHVGRGLLRVLPQCVCKYVADYPRSLTYARRKTPLRITLCVCVNMYPVARALSHTCRKVTSPFITLVVCVNMYQTTHALSHTHAGRRPRLVSLSMCVSICIRSPAL